MLNKVSSRISGKTLVMTFVMLVIAVVLLRHRFALDMTVSSLFFSNNTWLWPKADERLTFWLHESFRYFFITTASLGFITALVGIYYAPLKRLRYKALMVALSISLMAALVGGLKSYTHIYCPAQLQSFGGTIPDTYLEQNILNGRCFPASHPSPGFALLILGVIGTTRRQKRVGYTIGIAMGLLLSVIQLGRGEHFVSHCLATALIALWLAHFLVYMVDVLPVLFKTYIKRKTNECSFLQA